MGAVINSKAPPACGTSRRRFLFALATAVLGAPLAARLWPKPGAGSLFNPRADLAPQYLAGRIGSLGHDWYPQAVFESAEPLQLLYNRQLSAQVELLELRPHHFGRRAA